MCNENFSLSKHQNLLPYGHPLKHNSTLKVEEKNIFGTNFFCLKNVKTFNFMVPSYGWGSTASRLQSHAEFYSNQKHCKRSFMSET